MKKIVKNGLCMMLVLAIMLIPVLAGAQEQLAEEGSPAVTETETQAPKKGRKNKKRAAEDTNLGAQAPETATDAGQEAGPQVPSANDTPAPEAESTPAPEATPEAPADHQPEVPSDGGEQASPQEGDQGHGENPTTPDATQPPVEEPVQQEPVVEEPVEEEPVVYSTDLTQFVPNKDYGLFQMDARGKLYSLDGATLTLGKEFILAVSFKIDKPVLAGEEYVYNLPAFLAGNKEDQRQTFSTSKGDIATCYVKKDEVRVVFTQRAADILQSGQAAFNLTYGFIETLNQREVGEFTQFTVKLPMDNGRMNKLTINIDGHPANEPVVEEAVDQPTEEPAEQPTEEPAEQPTEEPAEQTTEEPAEQPTEQPTEEPIAVERQIIVDREMPEVIRRGQPFYVKATLIGFEGDEYALHWQYDAGQGWQDYQGQGTTLEVKSNLENVKYSWRVLAEIMLKATDDTAPQANGDVTADAQPQQENAVTLPDGDSGSQAQTAPQQEAAPQAPVQA